MFVAKSIARTSIKKISEMSTKQKITTKQDFFVEIRALNHHVTFLLKETRMETRRGAGSQPSVESGGHIHESPHIHADSLFLFPLIGNTHTHTHRERERERGGGKPYIEFFGKSLKKKNTNKQQCSEVI